MTKQNCSCASSPATTAAFSKVIPQGARLSQLLFSPGQVLVVYNLGWVIAASINRYQFGSTFLICQGCCVGSAPHQQTLVLLCCLPFNHLHSLPSACPSDLCTACPFAPPAFAFTQLLSAAQVTHNGDTQCMSNQVDSAMHGIS